MIPPGATIIFDIQFIRSYYADADTVYEHQGLTGDNMIGTGVKSLQRCILNFEHRKMNWFEKASLPTIRYFS